MEELEKYMIEFAEGVVEDAKKELQAKQVRTSYRAKWKKGKPYQIEKRLRRYVPETTGALADSIRYEIKEIGGNKLVVFYAEAYWYYVNFGRKAGKFAPVDVIRQWVYNKPIRPQKGGGKGFAKIGPKTYDTLAYLINRKIKWFGIEGTNFWTKTFEIYNEELVEKLGPRLAKDIAKRISKWPLQ
jgi:hypothetical protein